MLYELTVDLIVIVAVLNSPGEHSTSELHDRTDGHGLDQGQRPGRHRGRKSVGDIVGSDVPGIKESEEQPNHEDVRELRKGGHCVESRFRDLLCAIVLNR
jgi:hypothetical protein